MTSPHVPNKSSILAGLFLFIVVLLPVVVLPASLIASVRLALALHVSAAEGPRVWGFKALRRSWALSKGSLWTIFLIFSADWGIAALTGSLNSFDLHTKSLLASVGALGVGALAVISRTYLGVSFPKSDPPNLQHEMQK